MCPEPEDVCHLNFACCYGYEPLPTTETPTTLAPIPLTPQPPPIQGCRDHLSECRKKAYLCRHDSYRSFMITYCARSCHICTYSSPVYRPQACEDANLNCPEWVHNGFCSSGAYTKVEKERLCARSCGLCVERPEALPPPVPRPISTYTLYNVYLIPMPRIPHHVVPMPAPIPVPSHRLVPVNVIPVQMPIVSHRVVPLPATLPPFDVKIIHLPANKN
ncbi:hypothetical protein QR680_011913 [Steinernema hermaphroditum]|uniref:ShKT domain-containing protein n=1 Tax=Steinernema hermaphroditum TaxID=289476 RepID=A0AA39I2P5_9BILA|nr:hypothetical protein QR680_011913 [Steinernema hermaphroditum]